MGKFLELRDFEDYSYFDDNKGQPENFLSREEIIKLAEINLDYKRFKNKQIKIKALIYFLGTIGSRIDESITLKWSDLVESPSPMVHFRREMTKGKSGERWCPIPKWLCALLLSLPKENEFVFSKIDKANFRRDLELREKLAGISFHVTPHSFRDAAANNKLESGISIEEVATLLGHTKIDTTYKYYVRVKAKRLAQTLIRQDPSFKDDQTFDVLAEGVKNDLERWSNPRICDYVCETVERDGKRELVVRFIEKT